jgi:Predicted AAA-ATPase
MDAFRGRKRLSESKQVICWLEALLNSEFFAVIRQFCGKSVAKYWITGRLPAFRDGMSPLTATRLISFQEQYQSLCGFTQEDLDAIVTRAMRDFPENERISILAFLKRWYNGYMFSPTLSGSENLLLYNPQVIYALLKKIVHGPTPLYCIGLAGTMHSATLLSIIGEPGLVTISDFIRMLYSKANAGILSEFSFAELMQEQNKLSKDVIWSLLYYVGIVTFCEDSDHQGETRSLRVPNATLARLVSPGTFVLRRVLIVDFGSRRLADTSEIISIVILTSTRGCVNPTRISCAAIPLCLSNYSKTFSVKGLLGQSPTSMSQIWKSQSNSSGFRKGKACPKCILL